MYKQADGDKTSLVDHRIVLMNYRNLHNMSFNMFLPVMVKVSATKSHIISI